MVTVFFDASALIYLIEGREPFAGALRNTLQTLGAQQPEARTAVSRLTWLECRVGPLKADNTTVLTQYDAFFSRPDLIWVDLTQGVVELATEIRVRHGLRTPDALQAACCLQLGEAHLMLTGDAAFQRVGSLNVSVLR